jgi:hypothetical protein
LEEDFKKEWENGRMIEWGNKKRGELQDKRQK